MKCLFAVLVVATTLLGSVEFAHGHKKSERPKGALAKNATRTVITQSLPPPTPSSSASDNFYELNNKMLHGSAKLVRVRRSPRSRRSRKFGRRRPPFYPHRLPPIGRRRFPKRPPPPKIKFPHKHPKSGPPPPPGSKFGPPVGFFVMNIKNEIVHKSKDLGDIPPQYLDKIIPPNFIPDSPQKIYAIEHDDDEEEPVLGLGESKEVSSYSPAVNSYGQPIQAHQLDPQQYYPYPPSPAIESNIISQPTETRAHSHNPINNFYRGQSETQLNQDQPPPLVYHPPFKKNKRRKKKKQQQQQQPQHQPPPHHEFALQPDSNRNTYPISSYEVPLSYVPGPHEIESHSPPQNRYQQQQQPVLQQSAPRPRQPEFNVGQSYVESYSRDSSERDPPLLPSKYNQNDFKTTVNKSNNKKKVVYQVNTSYEDFDDQDHGLALDYPPPSEEENTEFPDHNFGVRNRKKKRPAKFDFIDSYEDSSISQEVYHTTPFTVTRPLRKSPPPYTTTVTKGYRPWPTTQDPLLEILDTDDLRHAFQSGRTKYKLEAYKKSKEPQNFVLLSSKNPSVHKATSKTPFLIHSGESSYEREYLGKKPKVSDNVFDRPPITTSLESDFASYEIAERDFGLRKRDFSHKRKVGAGASRKEDASSRSDTSIEKIQLSDARKNDEFVKATTMKPRFNPDVHFTKTFSSKIEQPREPSIWNGQAIPGNHKIAKRTGGGA